MKNASARSALAAAIAVLPHPIKDFKVRPLIIMITNLTKLMFLIKIGLAPITTIKDIMILML